MTRNLEYFEISNQQLRLTIHKPQRPKPPDPYHHPSQNYQGPIRGIVAGEPRRSAAGRAALVKQEQPQIKRPKGPSVNNVQAEGVGVGP